MNNYKGCAWNICQLKNKLKFSKNLYQKPTTKTTTNKIKTMLKTTKSRFKYTQIKNYEFFYKIRY